MLNLSNVKKGSLWRSIKRVMRARLFIAGSTLVVFLAFILTFTHKHPNLKKNAEPLKHTQHSQHSPQPKPQTPNAIIKQAPVKEPTQTVVLASPAPYSTLAEHTHSDSNAQAVAPPQNIAKPLDLKTPTLPNNDIKLTLLTPAKVKRIAIIIDDIGYSRDLGDAFINLPYALTLAFIPFSPYGKTLSQQAVKLNKSVMLHAPMATIDAKKWEESLSPNMSQQEIETLLNRMLEDVPDAVGVNNHGGSLFTQTDHSMNILLNALAQKKLFFIDSRTSAASVAKRNAYLHKVKFNQRDVFLDNVREEAAIESQLNKLISIAQKHDYAIGIAHPYPETLTVLSKRLSQLHKQNISLVSVSALLAQAEAK